MTILSKLIDPNSDVDDPIHREAIRKALNLLLTVEDYRAIGAANQPAFENTWSNRSGNPVAAFYKDPFRRVWLKGGIDSGTNSATAFTLPVGYRPSERRIFTTSKIAASNVSGIVVVNTDGTVVPSVGNTNGVSLDGMSFRVA
jgi:hypothetical protein